jgi:hypothetical protein
MSYTKIIIPDSHAHPDHHNDRATWLGHLIKDVRPDEVINIGDGPDLASLSAYDKGTRAFQGRNYRKDVDSFLDFEEKLWHPMKKTKKRLPKRVYLEGNHDNRITRALNTSPELDGAISFDDLELDYFYDEVIRYTGNTPGIYESRGIAYAHYFVSGVMGRPLGGEHPAYSLLTKKFQSCTAGHIHTYDHCVRTDARGNKMMGLVCGVYQDYNSDWAGVCNDLWHSGVVVKRDVEDGRYDLQWISIENLKKEYGQHTD